MNQKRSMKCDETVSRSQNISIFILFYSWHVFILSATESFRFSFKKLNILKSIESMQSRQFMPDSISCLAKKELLYSQKLWCELLRNCRSSF